MIDRFKTYQLPAKVERKDEVVIKAIGVAPRFTHAKPILKSEAVAHGDLAFRCSRW